MRLYHFFTYFRAAGTPRPPPQAGGQRGVRKRRQMGGVCCFQAAPVAPMAYLIPDKPRDLVQKRLRNPTTTVAHSTIVGPVGIRDAVLLITVPLTPAKAPKHPARNTISRSRFVHCRAATAGATSIALINTAPTACKPRTIAITRRLVSRISSARVGNPIDAAKPSSKTSNFNSFQNTNIMIRAMPPSIPMVRISLSKIVAACPKKKRI